MAWWKEKSSPGYFGDDSDDGDGAEERCSTRRIVKSSCKTDEVEPGRFVRKCEKTEQLLRQCAGRPAEIVESKTEHTEDDVSNEIKQGVLPFEPNQSEPFTFPGLRSDLESIEREFLGGFSNFMEAAEKITNEFLDAFGAPSIQRSLPSLERQRPASNWQHGIRTPKEMKDPYAALHGEIREV